MNCPVCQSNQNRKISSSQPAVFQFTADRYCCTCGSVWKPRCSKRNALFCISVGLIDILFIGGIFVVDIARGRTTGLTMWTLVFVSLLILGGLGAILYGFGVFFGFDGKETVLKTGNLHQLRPNDRPSGSKT